MEALGDTKLLISCVGENDPLYTSEVLLLFKSVKKFGGRIADAGMVANFVKEVDPIIKQELEEIGVQVTIVDPVERSKETTSNKIRMLEMDDYDFDVLIALDCDTVIVRDFLDMINPTFFQAMPAEMDLLVPEQWKKLFTYFGLNLPPVRFESTKKTIITYFSSAVMSVPKRYIRSLRREWDKYFFGLFEYSKNVEELAVHKYFFEELALSLAIEKEQIQSRDFPFEMNFPTNYPVEQSLKPDEMSPFIIHYHHLYNTDGSLAKSGYKAPDESIEKVNKFILLEPTSFKTYEKDIRRLQKVSIARQKLIEERERWLNVRDFWLKRAQKDVDTLQTINLTHQKNSDQKDVELLGALREVEILQKTIKEKDELLQLNTQRAQKDVDTLQTINLTHQKNSDQKDVELQGALREVEILQNMNLVLQKTIKEKDELLKQLNTQLTRANKDVHWLQSINHDHQEVMKERDNQMKERDNQIKHIISKALGIINSPLTGVEGS